MVKSSIQKVNQVCSLIRGKKALDAVLQLRFCRKSVARPIMTVLNSAIANSQNNYNLDIDKMYINRILVCKSRFIKRFVARAKGRANTLTKAYTKVSILLEEIED
jgi:large subunit ribosomal protein L22